MIDKKQNNRPAFTMIELVFVIVVLGILAAMAMPRLDRDLSQEAADDILSQIRYTQHLALVDDMHEFDDPQWQRKFWRIDFNACNDGSGLYFRIGSDANASGGGFAQNEAALDPSNSKAYFATNATCNAPATNPNVLLGRKYGVNGVVTGGGCNGSQYIGFDHLGRPHTGFQDSAQPNYASYMNADCNITFSSTNGTIDPFTITIKKETGYAFIDGQPNS